MKWNRARRSIRLKGYDYSRSGHYFITVCTQHRACLLGHIDNGAMLLNDAGRMVENQWLVLPHRFPHIRLLQHVVMPNHLHGIIHCRGEPCVRPENHGMDEGLGVNHDKGEHKVRPYGTGLGSLGRVVQAFKSITTHDYIFGVRNEHWPAFEGKLWQRNYWEHIVRDEDDFQRISAYIRDNPACWVGDKLNPDQAFPF